MCPVLLGDDSDRSSLIAPFAGLQYFVAEGRMFPGLGGIGADYKHLGLAAQPAADAATFRYSAFTMLSLAIDERSREAICPARK